MNGAPILWGSRKQIGIAASITNDEYVAGNIATKEVEWTWCLLMDLGFQQPSPTKLFNNNENNIQLIHNLKFNR